MDSFDLYFRNRLHEYFDDWEMLSNRAYSIWPMITSPFNRDPSSGETTSTSSGALTTSGGGGSGGSNDPRGISSGAVSFGRIRSDIVETPSGYRVSAELPGCSKENVSVSVEGKTVIIEAEKKHEQRKDDETAHTLERYYGKFRRTYRMPDDCNPEEVKPNFENGVLTLDFGKKESTNRRTITL